MNRTSLLLLTLGPLLLPSGAVHGTTTGFIQARLVISAACQISSGDQPPATLGNPGVMDFGERGPNWDQPLRSRVDEVSGEGRLQISCTPEVRAFNVRINGGLNGSDGVRRLSNGRQMIPYQLAVDPGGNSRYGIGQARAFTISSAQQIPIPIYGVVVAQPRALPAGLYRDTLRVTLDW
ncbi:spore coat protein U domain-containing protein [Pseudomonas putida]|uniref:Spore coat protein U domain-containing protein n=1 Tax=Pseudomonas putida TaxID=303 RepID=A0A7W2KY35_PSEPU|nr:MULTISPECIES: spore coat U domain-containing protein [Pseudomonas]MBA6114903.1 spore coat protein U domain-containing protein [Pseudomonas putida]MBI6940222.1 spore coat protein U domain-containing protein [Pseudomonas putida]MBI6957119.1 spore coat protein U domain-containing protein [Pseudomonas putida]MCZ9637010.1 spore coat U domain-containing protein [Pseudomonas putida]MEC4875086.1 spore coat U domain-containing protein [Pseudomonas sp. NC26]